MYFYELIKSIDEIKTIQEFMDLYNDIEDMNIDNTKKNIENVIDKLKNLSPNITDGMLQITRYIDDSDNVDDMSYDDLSLIIKDDDEKYSIVVDDWANVLGYLIEDNTLKNYDKEHIAALIMWEITWFGFDEESIKKHIASWDDEN